MVATGDLFEPAAAAPDLPLNRQVEPLDAHFDRIQGAWRAVTEPFRRSPQGRALIDWVDARVQSGAIVYPALPLRALELTPLESVRAVILGQDPYHGPGQAEGLAFSVPFAARRGQPWPPSLRNVLQEWSADLGRPLPQSGSLVPWARQGVLLLNTCLTVEDGQPASHAKRGWELLTDALVDAVVADARPKAFLLWGAHAQAKAPRIAGASRHWMLQTNHPSPLSAKRGAAPFVGSRPFGLAAKYLQQTGQDLSWSL